MYRANKKQALAHKAFMSDGFKRGLLFFGRQSGKTFFAVNHSWISAIKDQGRYFVVFKTYKQAHEVVWRQYVPLIPKELIYKKNEQDLLIEFNYIKGAKMKLPSGEEITINHDENLPRSSLQLLGSDQADSHRGFKANGIIFDEYADQDPDNWKAVYEPMFTTTNGWAIFMGTPRGYNHFYNLHQKAQEQDDWYYDTATWRDSPYCLPEHIARAKKDATIDGTLSTFMQEYELEFRAVQGAVYPSFDRNVHVIKPADVPLELTYYGAIDFGWHTTAFLLLGVDKDQNWYLIDEVYGKEETLDNIIPRIKAVIGDKRLVLVVGDSANRDAIEVMGRTYPMVGVNKANDIRGYGLGIALITEKLKPRQQLIGPPKPTLYVGSNCSHFIYELEAYRFPEEKPERNASDIPIKEDDHGCFVAGTRVGKLNIEDIGVYMGKKDVYAYRVGNTILKATSNHPILTNRGLVSIDTLRYNDVIWQKQLFTTVINGHGIPTPLSGMIGCIFSALKRQIQASVRDYIDISGEKRTVKSLMGMMFITLITIPLIMKLLILSVISVLNTSRVIGMRKNADGLEIMFIKLSKGLLSGQKLPKVRRLGLKWAKKMLNTFQDIKSREYATYVGDDTLPRRSSVVSATGIVEPLHYVGVEKVWNLRTRSGMYRANGIVTSNCDAIRYLFLHLKYGIAKDDKPLEFEMEKQANEFGLL